MMRGDELVAFSRTHGCPMLTIDELVSYRRDGAAPNAQPVGSNPYSIGR